MNNFRDMIPGWHLKWENEDELPLGITDEIYHVMFPTSIVNGVRYFPYLECVDGTKFYLIKLDD
jgi:hypothetical protein